MPDSTPVFLGTYMPRLDEKGRVILPAKFAEPLTEGVVITRGQEHCLYLFTRDMFERMHNRLRQAPITSREVRNYMRVFLSGAHDEIPDRQRRVTIPPLLRTYAGLAQELAVLGVGERIEIWDAATWEAHLATTETGFADIEEEVFPGLI